MIADPIAGMCKGIFLTVAAAAVVAAGPPLQSGPQVGGRPLPFTSNLVTGAFRGEQHCYVCTMAMRPAILIFVRSRDAATARLLRHLRDAVSTYSKEKLFGWFVCLGKAGGLNESALESACYTFARTNNATTVPVSALGDPHGPPGYRIAPDAQVTIVAFQSNKVLYNRALRADEWNDKAADDALTSLTSWFGAVFAAK